MMILRRLVLAISFQLGRTIAQFQRLLHRRGRSGDRPQILASNPYWRRLRSQAGFVLPTTALLLVVVALTITALSLRTLNRTDQVAADRAQKVIYNAATPAIDRAKAKLEKLFTQDPRLTSNGAPSEKYLLSMLLNKNLTGSSAFDEIFNAARNQSYTFPGEQQIDMNGDGQPDPAWKFPVDTNGDGQEDADVAYSLIFTTPPANSSGKLEFDMSKAALQGRVAALQTRTGPLIQQEADESPCNLAGRLSAEILPPIEAGWYQDQKKTSTLRKNFQVDAVVIPKRDTARSGAGTNTIATLEFQQDRIVEKGNKWGAWFRNDLELFSGAAFNWNGAMHTEGSMFLAGANNPTRLFWVSAPSSCLYQDPEASSISASPENPEGNASVETCKNYTSEGICKNFKGDLISSAVSGPRSNFGGNPRVSIDYRETSGRVTEANLNFTTETDSVNFGGKAIDLALDPLLLYTQDASVRRKSGKVRADGWNTVEGAEYSTRFSGQAVPKPYLDDFYRADNRYGPRPTYGRTSELRIPGTKKVGDNITDSQRDRLTRNTNTEQPAEVGADGYWERRAINEGTRIITGQRLELENPLENPLGYPSQADEFDATTPLQALQRRSYKDNPAAVQGTLLFHKGVGQGVKPVAALTSTVHPGTPDTLKQSATFEKLPVTAGVKTKPEWTAFGERFGDESEELAIDFFHGRGTNGWEMDVDRLNELVSVSTGPTSTPVNLNATLRKALENLATFAGDKDGAFPAKQEAGKTHPLPQLVKWGDFSNLRRALYDTNNSPADATTQQTAALSTGMLAYNIAYLDAIDYSDPDFQTTVLDKLAEALGKIGDNDPAWNKKEDPSRADWLSGARTDSANDRKLGRVDIFRPGDTTGPFSVRVYPGNSGLRSPSDFNSRNQEGADFVEVQLASLKTQGGQPLASPPLLKRIPAADPALKPGENPFAATTASTDEVTPLVPPEAYVAALADKSTSGAALNRLDSNPLKPTELQQWARLIALREQIQRDRTFGFATHFGRVKNTAGSIPAETAKHHYSYTVQNDLTPTPPSGSLTVGYAFGGRVYEQAKTYEFGCDFSKTTGNNYFGYGVPGTVAEEKRFLHLAGTLCPVEPEYPALYYLFPRPLSEDFIAHDADGDKTVLPALEVGTATLSVEVDHTQPKATDPFYAPYDKLYFDPYLTVAQGNFQVLSDKDLESIMIKPRKVADWLLPVDDNLTPTGDCTNSAPNCSQMLFVAVDNDGAKADKAIEYHRVAFKDAALMDGRERLVERVLDIDIDMLRQKTYAPSALGDLWLTFGNLKKNEVGGIVYAFREDNTREDAIERSPSTTWSSYNIDTESARMSIGRGNPLGQDPPISDVTGISPKPVDYYADPDRRPHGFRLINGSLIKREGGGDEKSNIAGMSFITDNPLFVKGDFNLHRVGGVLVEEFKTLLNRDNYGNFYSRGSRSPQDDLNTQFARLGVDTWRPVELLADSITLVSSNFCDGSVRDTFLNASPKLADWYGCQRTGSLTSPTTSFYAQNRPLEMSDQERDLVLDWWHENRFDFTSSVAVDYTGKPLQRINEDAARPEFGRPNPYTGNYQTVPLGQRYGGGANGVLPGASTTEANAIFISGIGSSRENQSYGGFHNFLPLLENWGTSSSSQSQTISGAFLQLNFRTSSTGPYEHDAWEINQRPVGGQDDIPYYQTPRRRWGYDVGLQYAPVGPISSRFITIGNTRSEFYNEPEAGDPYICALRRSIETTPDGC